MLINVKVTANAAKNEVIKKSDTEFIVKITTAPEKGKANIELKRFLAEEFEVSKDGVVIISGAGDPLKLIRIEK